MPRPKRTKVASTNTTTTRVAKPLKATPVPRQKPQVSKAHDRTESLSDDSDGLVVRSTRVRRRMPWEPEPQKDVDLTMTGALPVKNGKKSGTTPRSGEPLRMETSLRSGRIPSSDVSRKSRTSNGSANTYSDALSPTESRPVVPLTVHDAPVEEDDSTGFGDNLLTFTSFDSDSPAHGTRPPSAMKIGGTPAHETSILALTNFRRRARQPSLLRMVHQTTDVEYNELDNLNDLGDMEELDDFHPEHESTPLHVHKSTHGIDAGNTSGLNLSSSGSRSRKRKLSSPVIQVPRSSPPYDPPSGADVTESRAASPSLPEGVVESREGVVEDQEEADVEIMSETMAPPRSSSPPADEIEDPPDSPVKSRERRTRRAPTRSGRNQDLDEDELDRPAKPRARNKPKAHHGISTAKLQSLLPRRRTRVPQERDEYDIQDSDEIDETPIDSDQDELQLPNPRRAPPARKGVISKPSKKSTRTAKKSTVPTKTAQKSARTYTRRTSSDKENVRAVVVDGESGDVEETTEPSIVLPKPQLAAIAKQFEDVDAWEMDFESVDPNGDDSSPWR
ncbi:hypothetical protein K505DRAFT_326346 [Melanomma pulvis-pyrius CBS 109.77]|uniref:Uncharacterized protein n=1 Tax=Melanomma pulvis-pyrius CBS 109.77 TaxID=1314802 RepID=A0A6A6X7E8_9PLEO|nr:hypothetical protein K505DRAFT_326346 [Melanomma pulvis-pyrius CBS 109.77]